MGSRPVPKYLSTSECNVDIPGFLRIHKDGRCERLVGNDIIPPGTDTSTGVISKEVIISHESKVFVRMYINSKTCIATNHKLPTLIYYHGGAFLTESAASSTYHPTLNLITKESNLIVVSVNYRLAPEHLLPTAYEDSWEAVNWVATHVKGNGPESWLNDHANLQNVFFAGDSAGANIAHNMAIRLGLYPINDIKLAGVILLHPYFGGEVPIEGENLEYKTYFDQVWRLVNRPGVGLDDLTVNPGMDPRISSFGCSKILLCVGEKDKVKERGYNYKNVMENSGWKGRIEFMETKGEGHVFFLFNSSSENARMLRNRICTFINPNTSKI
ncbi:probable carboxylesterase 12 [Rutidosis leptorrhynchoides]|uniref:probable carboxylesterase 12 n=1 Tax=Rutidosis leptorrhynchoides TaxID=125765 RepID=UPI003A990AA4